MLPQALTANCRRQTAVAHQDYEDRPTRIALVEVCGDLLHPAWAQPALEVTEQRIVRGAHRSADAARGCQSQLLHVL
jgi:hypothetical protein